jgi:hypothetical protein
MPRNSSRILLPALALIALTLLTPTRTTALPQGATLRSAAEHLETAPGLFAKLWDLLSAVWATGAILEPNGASAAPGTEPSTGSGDTGSGLDPNG